MDSLPLCFPRGRVSRARPCTVSPFPALMGCVCAYTGLPTFLLIKMAVIPDYCNGLMVLCAWLIPPVYPPTHPFIDAFTSKQLLSTYHSTCRGTVGCRALELPLGSASQCAMEVRHTPTGNQAGMGQHPEDKVESRGKGSACGGSEKAWQKRPSLDWQLTCTHAYTGGLAKSSGFEM